MQFGRREAGTRGRNDDCGLTSRPVGRVGLTMTEICMHSIIYIVGLVVIVLAILSFIGFA